MLLIISRISLSATLWVILFVNLLSQIHRQERFWCSILLYYQPFLNSVCDNRNFTDIQEEKFKKIISPVKFDKIY